MADEATDMITEAPPEAPPAAVPVLDAPAEVSGKRVRKTVEKFVVEEKEEKEELVVEKGTGTLLGEIDNGKCVLVLWWHVKRVMQNAG